MNRSIHLDDARLGLASPSSRRAQQDLARLSGDPRWLLYFTDFLCDGFDAWPSAMQSSYPDLSCWGGVSRFSTRVKRTLHADSRTGVFLAARTATLMRLSSDAATRRCRRVLTVDLLWRPYREMLSRAVRRRGVALRTCRIRHAALHQGATSSRLADLIVERYLAEQCDGLVLPSIDHRGVWLPVERIVRQVERLAGRPASLIVDGSQAFAHTPVDLSELRPDCFIAPAHKWLGGGHPLGVGIVSGRLARVASGPLLRSDPVLRLTQEAIGGLAGRHGETAPVHALVSATAALQDLRRDTMECRFSQRLENRSLLQAAVEEGTGWKSVGPALGPHGMLLFRPPRSRPATGREREQLARLGVGVTQYRSGLVRVSCPAVRLDADDLRRVTVAFSVALGLRVSASPPKPLLAARRRSGPVALGDQSDSIQPSLVPSRLFPTTESGNPL